MKRCIPLLIALVIITSLAACGSNPPANTTPTQGGKAPEQYVTEPPAVQPTLPPTSTGETAAGDFSLTDPAVGLSALSAYRQELTITFNGTVDGVESSTTTTLRRTVQAEPFTQLTWLEDTGAEPYFFGQVGDVHYAQAGDDACFASVDQPAAGDAFRLEILPAVRGAVLAGEETLNGITARRYTFDQSALSLSDVVAEGELWVAVEGGYLLQYTLHAEGTFGPSADGAQDWSYTLLDPDAVADPGLPAACAAHNQGGDLPIPPEGEVTIRQPGLIQYIAALSPQQVFSFYSEGAAALSWTDNGVVETPTGGRLLAFVTADNNIVHIAIEPHGAGVVKVTAQTVPGL